MERPQAEVTLVSKKWEIFPAGAWGWVWLWEAGSGLGFVQGWLYQLCQRDFCELQQRGLALRAPKIHLGEVSLCSGVWEWEAEINKFWFLLLISFFKKNFDWEAINHRLSSLIASEIWWAISSFLNHLSFLIYPFSLLVQLCTSEIWGDFFESSLLLCSVFKWQSQNFLLSVDQKGSFAVPVPGLCFPTAWKTWIISVLILTCVLCLLMEGIQSCSLGFSAAVWCSQLVIIGVPIRNHPNPAQLNWENSSWSILCLCASVSADSGSWECRERVCPSGRDFVLLEKEKWLGKPAGSSSCSLGPVRAQPTGTGVVLL